MLIVSIGAVVGIAARLAFHGIFAKGQIHAIHGLPLVAFIGLGIWTMSPVLIGFVIIDVVYYSLCKTDYLPKYAKLLDRFVNPFVRGKEKV